MPKCELMRLASRIRRRFAPIIKTGPDEAAAQPRTVGEKAPPCFRRLRPLSVVHIIGTDVAALLVVLVNAPRADGAGLFRADIRLVGMLGVVAIHGRTGMIIPAAHVNDAVDAGERVAFRRGVSHRSRRVEPLHIILHRARDGGALRRVLHIKFLVGDGPDADARVIAVAANLIVPLLQILLVAAKQPAFVHDDHAEMVARIEQFRRGRIVRGADGVAAKLL